MKEKDENVHGLEVEPVAEVARSEKKSKAAVVEFKKSDEMQYMLEEKGKAAVKEFKESEEMKLVLDKKEADSYLVQGKSMMFKVRELGFLIESFFKVHAFRTCAMTGFLIIAIAVKFVSETKAHIDL